MADIQDQNESKGQQFVTRSFLRNQAANAKDGLMLQNVLTSNVKAIDSLSKQIAVLNQNLSKMSKPVQQKKDFVRREDPMVKLYKSVDDLEELIRENNELQKQKQKQKGLFDWLGPLFGLGGLIGFFLTGKKEMLFSTIKAFTKYSPLKFILDGIDHVIKKGVPVLWKGIVGMFTGIGDKILKIPGVKKVVKFADKLIESVMGMFKGIGDKILKMPVVKNVGKFADKLIESVMGMFKGIGDKILKMPVVKNVGKFADKLIKSVMGMFKGISNVFKPLGKLFEKVLGKEFAKQGAKGLGKTFLKKIPIIGSLMGLFFGIQRFKKGDWFGGLLEVASGLTSLIPIPGVGTALGFAVDAFLLFRDFAGPEKLTPNVGGMVKGALNIGKKVGIEVLKSMPGIGIFLHFKEAMNLWGTDKLGAMKEIALAVTSVVPGANLILDPVLSFIEGFIKDKGGIGKVASNVLSTAKEVITHPIQSVGKLLSEGKEAVGGAVTATKGVVGGAIQTAKELPGKIVESALQGSRNYLASSQNFLDSSKGGVSYKNIDSTNMVPWVWQNFQSMAAEYSSLTGKDIRVNSAYRSIEKQKQLYEDAVRKYGLKGASKYVAPPGKSMHNYGYAIDINSSDANFLQTSGLLEKYGFTRPMSHEPWHIEPVGLKEKYASIRKGVQADAPIGDAYAIGGSLPSKIISDKQERVTREKLDLSDSTIQALAQAIGTSFKGAIPRGRANQISIDANMRG